MGAVVLIFVEWPFGIIDEARLEKHFQRNQPALEAVVEEALNADIRVARRGSRTVYSRTPQYPEGEQYEPLFRVMRRAKVLKVKVSDEAQPDVTLITGTISHMIDWEDFGYFWTPDAATKEGVNLEGEHKTRLIPHWFLYNFATE